MLAFGRNQTAVLKLEEKKRTKQDLTNLLKRVRGATFREGRFGGVGVHMTNPRCLINFFHRGDVVILGLNR